MQYPKTTSLTFIAASVTLLLSACGGQSSVERQAQNNQIQVELAQQPLTQSGPLADRKSHTTAKTTMGIASETTTSNQFSNDGGIIAPTASGSIAELIAVPENNAASEKYAEFDNNRTIPTRDQAVSTFSIDVDTGAYANVRRFLQNGQLPPVDAVRIEEMLNYFNYDYVNNHDTEQPFSVVTEIGQTPWNENTHLLHIGLQGYTPADIEKMPANLVFLIDVSGSMATSEKLGLLKSAMSLMTRELNDNDLVSIVVYAGASGVVLEPTAGDEHATIERALAQLEAGGSTNGADGLALAYQLAMDNYIENGTNRVIVATDGDFNVGISDTDSLIEMIEKSRRAGVALTTLGFGMGNYNDHLMEQLADAGNGNYAYIDTLGEARKVLVDELTATLVTIASDVKIQIEFNPATVSEYRLIGYTNRILNNEDFDDDKVDAGEIGAGHSVTALYEVALTGQGGERHTERRYDNLNNPAPAEHSSELAELRLRYKQPGADDSQLISQIISKQAVLESLDDTSNAFRFAASVAGFGQLLRGDTRVNTFNFDDARTLATTHSGPDTFGYRSEYLRMLDLAQSLNRLDKAVSEPRG